MSAINTLMQCPAWARAYALQREVLVNFYQRCAVILGNKCSLKPLDDSVLESERNLFSTLFIATTSSLRLSEQKSMFYAQVNQCIRALVTGCDNILDDEYKEVIPFDMLGSGSKFRSILTLMVADRVLWDLATDAIAAGTIGFKQVRRLARNVLHVLLPSGLQEHEEEAAAIPVIPTPDEMINDVHHRKTGLLFEAPLSLIESMGDASSEQTNPARLALHALGIGCQVLDDMKDLDMDLKRRRPNLTLALAYHGSAPKERLFVQDNWAHYQLEEDPSILWDNLPHALDACRRIVSQHFDSAQKQLPETIEGFDNTLASALIEVMTQAIGNPPISGIKAA